MNSPESDPKTELMQSIASSLKGIQSSLDRLTQAVEGVAESIEIAHEPEGDLGLHLVSALKDLSSALHKRAQQERTPTHTQRHNQQQHAPRRDERPPQRHDQHIQQDRENYYPPADELNSDPHEDSGQSGLDLPLSEEMPNNQNPQAQGVPRPRKPRPNRRRGRAPHDPKPAPPQVPPTPATE